MQLISELSFITQTLKKNHRFLVMAHNYQSIIFSSNIYQRISHINKCYNTDSPYQNEQRKVHCAAQTHLRTPLFLRSTCFDEETEKILKISQELINRRAFEVWKSRNGKKRMEFNMTFSFLLFLLISRWNISIKLTGLMYLGQIR